LIVAPGGSNRNPGGKRWKALLIELSVFDWKEKWVFCTPLRAARIKSGILYIYKRPVFGVLTPRKVGTIV
jgi:hypothetical protein